MSVEAGWGPDPSGMAQERFWDGQSWTEKVRPSAPPTPGRKPSRADRVLIVIGSVLAFLGVAFSFIAGTSTKVSAYGYETQGSPTAVDFLLIIAGVVMLLVGVALKFTRR